MSLTNPTTEVKVNGTAIATQNILNINIHLGCTREVNSFEVVVNNSNPDYYSGQYAIGGAKEFTKGHSVTIKIKRGTISASTNYLITGNLESLEYTDQKEEYQYRDVVILRGRCTGQRLFNRKYNGDLIADVGIGYQNFNRWGSTEDLTGDAASAQKVVAVVDGSTFSVGDVVNIYDDTPQIEENTIASISGNNLTMENNLSHTYTTANNALVAYMRSGDASSLVAHLLDNYTANQSSTFISHVRTTDDLASNATQYEKTIVVTDGTKFTAGRLIIIKDDNNWEYNRILSISTNTLTLYNPLLQNYTTAANCIVGQSLIYASNTDFTKMDFTYETVFDIIKFIADTTSSLASVIGFDARIEYDGVFSFIPLNSATESYSLSGECQLERYIDDATRIKNQIRVFGKQDKPYPLGDDGFSFSDIWTESIPVDRDQVASNVTAGDDYVRVANVDYFDVGDYVTLGSVVYFGVEIKTIERIVDAGDNSLLTGDANSGQKVVNVADGSKFTVGDVVTISDDTPQTEDNRIASISTNQLTMENNLAHTYTTAQNALVTQIDDVVYLDAAWENNYTTGNNSVLFQIGEYGGWVYTPYTQWDSTVISNGSNEVYEGDKSVEVNFNAGLTTVRLYLLFPAGINFNDYLKLFAKIYFGTTAPDHMYIWLLTDGSNGVSSNKITGLEADKWISLEYSIGEDNADSWINETGTLNWESIRAIEFEIVYSGANTDPIYIDRMFINGKRWGGISGGGLAEDATSQSTYGVKEHVVINDGLLADTECEAKAQALLLYYKNPRVTIELESKTLNIVDYPIIPGNKVPVNLPLHSISGNYRIDSCDINCSADDDSLSFKFTLETTPPKVADYLYYIYKKLGGLERYGYNK